MPAAGLTPTAPAAAIFLPGRGCPAARLPRLCGSATVLTFCAGCCARRPGRGAVLPQGRNRCADLGAAAPRGCQVCRAAAPLRAVIATGDGRRYTIATGTLPTLPLRNAADAGIGPSPPARGVLRAAGPWTTPGPSTYGGSAWGAFTGCPREMQGEVARLAPGGALQLFVPRRLPRTKQPALGPSNRPIRLPSRQGPAYCALPQTGVWVEVPARCKNGKARCPPRRCV